MIRRELRGVIGVPMRSAARQLERLGLIDLRVTGGYRPDTAGLLLAGGVEDRIAPLVRALHRPDHGLRTIESCAGHPRMFGLAWERAFVAIRIDAGKAAELLARIQCAVISCRSERPTAQWSLEIENQSWMYWRVRPLRHVRSGPRVETLVQEAVRSGIQLRLSRPMRAWTDQDQLAEEISWLADAIHHQLRAMESDQCEARGEGKEHASA